MHADGRPLRLNLASGTDLKPADRGWVNLDIVPQWPGMDRGCDVIWDARKDAIPFPDDSAEEVYAGYLLLHLPPQFHAPVLAEILRVLAPSGVAVFGEVDMDLVMRRFLANPLDKQCRELIWGEQGSVHGDDLAQFDTHHQGHTPYSLTRALQEAGFVVGGPVRVHGPATWYELSLACGKPPAGAGAAS